MSENRFKRALAAGGGQEPDPATVAAFIAGADSHEAVPAVGMAEDAPKLNIISVPECDQGGKLSDGVLFRCTPAIAQELEFVFKHSTAKSKQKLLESIVLPRLAELAKKIRSQG